MDGAPEHANSGRQRSAAPLITLWEWISRDLLPTMTRDYVTEMTNLIAIDKQKEARQATSVFQTKVVKSSENTLRSPGDCRSGPPPNSRPTRLPGPAYDDLTKMLCILRAREVLAKFNKTLPERLDKFDDAQIAKITQLLDGFAQGQRRRPSLRACAGGCTAADFLGI